MLIETVQGGASLTVPMPYDEYEALGETKHTAYHDQLAHVNPPPRADRQAADPAP